MIDRAHMGRLVRRLRDSHGWSQIELARRAQVAQASVSLLEKGVGNPTISLINSVATALGVHPLVLVMPEPMFEVLKRLLNRGGAQ